MADERLTVKQRRFIQVYNGNGTEAARLAGYSGDENAMAVAASDLLRLPKIANAIKARENKAIGPKIASREERQSFWTQVMIADEVDMRDRLKASELLGKSQADFTDKIEHSGKIGIYEAKTDQEIDARIDELLGSKEKIETET